MVSGAKKEIRRRRIKTLTNHISHGIIDVRRHGSTTKNIKSRCSGLGITANRRNRAGGFFVSMVGSAMCETRICRFCGKEKAIGEFYKNNNTEAPTPYYAHGCKECMKSRARLKYSKATPIEVEQRRIKSKSNRKKYYNNRTNEQKSVQREKRKDRHATMMADEAAHREHRLYMAKWWKNRTEAQKERCTTYCRRWRENNPDKVRGLRNARRAHKERCQIKGRV